MQRSVIKLLVVVIVMTLSTAQLHAKPVNVPVVYYKLPNGLKVVISEDHIAPVVTVGVYYNVGFRVEPKGRTGFAHLFEHMCGNICRCGTYSRIRQAIHRAAELKAAGRSAE